MVVLFDTSLVVFILDTPVLHKLPALPACINHTLLSFIITHIILVCNSFLVVVLDYADLSVIASCCLLARGVMVDQLLTR